MTLHPVGCDAHTRIMVNRVLPTTARPRIVASGCFGMCPKRASTTASGAALARGEFLLRADETQARSAAAQ
jgi:hypothetical protein